MDEAATRAGRSGSTRQRRPSRMLADKAGGVGDRIVDDRPSEQRAGMRLRRDRALAWEPPAVARARFGMPRHRPQSRRSSIWIGNPAAVVSQMGPRLTSIGVEGVGCVECIDRQHKAYHAATGTKEQQCNTPTEE